METTIIKSGSHEKCDLCSGAGILDCISQLRTHTNYICPGCKGTGRKMKENEMKKPPLGLCPRNIWLSKRETDIRGAIMRYLTARKVVPKEWLQELIEIQEELEKYNVFSG